MPQIAIYNIVIWISLTAKPVLGHSLFLLKQQVFWPSYCQISTDLDTILHTPIVVRNTLVDRLRPWLAHGEHQANQNDCFCNTCNAP